jgi:hypothetical protein
MFSSRAANRGGKMEKSGRQGKDNRPAEGLITQT